MDARSARLASYFAAMPSSASRNSLTWRRIFSASSSRPSISKKPQWRSSGHTSRVRATTAVRQSARQAAVDAMREVFSAVVVIGIVLVAVFVPVAFFPGVTGRLYQQFSLTIAFAVLLSVFNALTLTQPDNPLLPHFEHRPRSPTEREKH